MDKASSWRVVAAAALALAAAPGMAAAQQDASVLGFFVTSVGLGQVLLQAAAAALEHTGGKTGEIADHPGMHWPAFRTRVDAARLMA